MLLKDGPKTSLLNVLTACKHIFINISLYAWVDLAEVESVEGCAACCEDLGDKLIWHSKGVSMNAFACMLISA